MQEQANVEKKDPRFRTRWYHRKPASLLRLRRRPPGRRSRPEVVRFEPEPGVEPSARPPVRIYVGTEPAQYRAERVFVWSVRAARDRGRRYEIHLMKDLAGFNRRHWKTGFTGYRYAIPDMAGGAGRAIYNDVDQIYLADPGELFDMDMDGAGIMSVTRRDNSVMLIDCERMHDVWDERVARERSKHKHFRARALEGGLWRELPGEWNAREHEYRAARSKLLHYTTLQTQPWQPFPSELKYGENPNAEVWRALERDADAAGFTVFTEKRPSRRYLELLDQYRRMHTDGASAQGMAAGETFDGHSLARHVEAIAALVRETSSSTLLDYGAGKGQLYDPYPGKAAEGSCKTLPAWGDVEVTCYDPAHEPFCGPYEGRYDGVICTDVLEHIPEDDIGWVLDELFTRAQRFVYAVAACYPARKTLPDGENAHCTLQSPEWWHGQFELAARRRPGVDWVLAVEDKPALVRRRRYYSNRPTWRKLA